MLRYYLGQTWVLVAAFIIGPAILIWQYRRRRRLEEGKKGPGRPAVRKVEPPKAAPALDTERDGLRKALWPGYRDMRWGQPPAEGMTVLHEEGDTRFLVRSADELLVGSVLVTSIVYSFRLDRLEAVIIELPMSGFELLLRNLTAEWGPPRSTADRGRHAWTDSDDGPESSQAVLEKRVAARTARLVLSSRAANAERAKTRPGV